MDGHWTLGGWSSFFPIAFWEKTSPALLILLAAGLVGWFRGQRLREHPALVGDHPAVGESFPSFYYGSPYFVMVVAYFIIAMLQQVDIGHRHILPIYPALYILCGGPIALLWPTEKLWARVATIMVLAWFVVESLMLFPDYLAYFSPLAGGPAKGYLHLVDSSLDWGMDLPGVKKWLDKNDPHNREPVFLAYFGTDSPDYYGIKSHRLPGNPEWRVPEVYPFSPGIYIISATLYESVYTYAFGPWNTEYENRYQTALHNIQLYQDASGDSAKLAALLKQHPQKFWNNEYSLFEKLRFGRLCAWLRYHRPTPDAAIGHSILIWRLSDPELAAALLGPPPEINDTPLM